MNTKYKLVFLKQKCHMHNYLSLKKLAQKKSIRFLKLSVGTRSRLFKTNLVIMYNLSGDSCTNKEKQVVPPYYLLHRSY